MRPDDRIDRIAHLMLDRVERILAAIRIAPAANEAARCPRAACRRARRCRRSPCVGRAIAAARNS